MNDIAFNASELINTIREKKPLVHHITNYVTVNDCANITLAIGASPVMADDISEAADITSISQSLVINIGTLNERTIRSMVAAGKKANELNIPVVLDPVGAGASAMRNKTTNELLKHVKFAVVRGNISEMRYIAGLHAETKGVDASESDLSNGTQNRALIANTLAERLGCVIAITGAVDIVSNGEQTVRIENGHNMLGAVTGTGCMCTSLISSACGAVNDYFLAAVSGILFMCIAGELAFEVAGRKGTASFRTAIIDSISTFEAQTIHTRSKIYES